MAKHLKVGAQGEHMAALYLERKGYQVLEKNWRSGRAEVDIIAKLDELLVFVEVKTRSTDYTGVPALAVTHRKQRLIADAASAYMDYIGHEWEIRFDIISIIMAHRTEEISHYEDAFFPGW